ncbi:pentatricopeptide repeat-containing protein 1, mitochondrial isoform X1 [Hyperolius riggenbachi]|uniref:pentatricopeptide repeat-containing protein 1, mitochondrial isoform X1 n=1 Tax=Hyperolius riggenbachi TaxID=752182 RepID=UPI0035A26246
MLQLHAKIPFFSKMFGFFLHDHCACSLIRTIHRRTLSKNCLLLCQPVIHSMTRNYCDDIKPSDSHPSQDDFGTLSQRYSSRTRFIKSTDFYNIQSAEDEEDEEEKSVQKMHKGRRNTQYWYFLQCKAKIKEGKLAEALELFEVRMLQEERLQPEEYNYTVLIGGCGRSGYIKKAFQLYSNMKKRGLIPTDATYTALFNSCAESPWKDTGLQYAFKLRKELMDKNIQLNLVTYNALLKAVVMCSGLQASLEIFQEIAQKCNITSPDAFSFLLMGCIKDEKLGFRYTLQVWRQMLHWGIKPDIYTYNLLLRATKDCGIGDPVETLNLLLHSKELNVLQLSAGKDQNDKDVEELRTRQGSIKGGFHESKDHLSSIEHQTSRGTLKRIEPPSQPIPELLSPACSIPNLLDLHLNADSIVSLGDVNTPYEKFALIGNLEGILQKMKEDHVCPTIKTFTLLAELMKPDSQTDATLLALMNSFKIKPDLTFFNTLILKRSEVSLKSAMELLPVLAQRGIAPDMYTFCNLAKACHNKEDGLQLLQDMGVAGFQPNSILYSILIGLAIKRLDYVYLTNIIRDMKWRKVVPNEVVIRQLEFASNYPPTFERTEKKNVFKEKIDGFRGYYKRWLNWMDVEEKEHPWKKYQCKPEKD